MAFTFDPLFATDPNNAANVAANASIIIFDPADVGQAPITITDVTGVALPNPITVNKNGFGPAFTATIDRVAWSGGGFTGYFTSYEGMKLAATDAAAAAEAAQSAAETAGVDAAAVAEAALAGAVADAEAAQAAAETAAGLVGAPADTAVQTLITTPASATAAALNAAYATPATVATAVAPKLDRTQIGWEAIRTQNYRALQNWFSALGNRDTAPAKMVIIGDSVTEGSGASTRPSTKRWVDGVRDRLRTRYPTTGIGAGGGIGYIPTQYAGGSVAAPTNFSGSNTADNANGLGMRARVLNSGAAAQWNNVQGTAVDLFYLKGNSSRIMTIKVDTVQYGAPLETNSGTGSVTDTGIYRVPLGASGVHTVNVAQSGGSAVYPEGIYVYDGDETKGIHVYEAGHHGFETTEFTASTTHATRVASVNANLVVIALGENDFLHDKSSATMRTNLGTMVDAIKTAQTNPDPSFLFVINYKANYATPLEPWQNYVDAIYGAAVDKGAAVVDLSIRMPNIAGDGLSLYSDLYHPNDKGYAMMADPIMEALSPR